MAADDEDYGSARITITLDDTDIVGESRDLGLRIQRALLRATRDTGAAIRRQIQRGLSAADLTVRVDPDLSRFDSALLTGLRSLGSINLPVAPDLTGFVERIRALLAGQEVTIRVVPDLDDFDARIRAHRPPSITIRADLDVDVVSRALAGLTGIAGRVAGALGGLLRFGAVGIAVAGAATAVVGLVGALAPAAGILAAFPALIIGWQAALGTLRLALMGVSEAFGAALTGSSEEFTEALEDLSPAARAAALEVRALKPAFEALRNSVQDAFFSQIEGQITATAQALSGPMRSGLTAISQGWGEAAAGVLGYVQGAQGVANVESILDATALAVDGLGLTTNKLTAGLLQVAAVISDRFGAELSGGIANLGESFGLFLQRAAAGGDAVRWVDQALTVFAQLGDIIGNVGSILSGVFAAANVSGGGFLANIQQITRAVAELVNSAQGQEAIGAIFTAVAGVAAQLGPIVAALVTQIGGIASALGPGVFTQLGAAIVALVNAVGPALAVLAPSLEAVGAALNDAFTNVDLTGVAGSIGSVVTSLAPSLPPLVDGITSLAVSAGDLLEVLAPVTTLLLQLLGHVVEYGAPVIVAATVTALLAKAFLAAKAAILAVRIAWAALTVTFAASPIGLIVLAVIGLATAVYLAYQRFEGFRNVVDSVGSAIKTGFLAAVDFVLGLPEMIGGALSSFGSTLSGFFGGLWAGITGGLSAGADGVVTFFSGLWASITSGVSTAFNAVIGFFVALPGRIGAALAALPGFLVNVFTSAIAFLIIAALTQLAALIYVFTELPAKIGAGLMSLGSTLAGLFTTALTLVTATISGWVSTAVAFFTALPGRARAGLSSLGSSIGGVLSSAFSSASARISGWISTAVAFFSALPGRVGGALSALPGRVSAMFQSAGTSAMSAARSLGSSVVSFFSALPGRIAGALKAVGSRIAGVFRSALGAARGAVNSLISSIVSLFSGLPGKIVGALGDIGGQIMAKVKGGLPSGVAELLPFANGGVVDRPTAALIGEAGREVVIPLTRPQRARQLADESGLLDILAGARKATPEAAMRPVSQNTFHIYEVGDASVTAQRVVNRIALTVGA
ncbi:hypothetical protein ACFTTN_13880 [Streptomyces niveus]|uniref:hypothetical protein n=1 Tax=Streptomyces niveus TaxID=193462 RepID=UPI0036443121